MEIILLIVIPIIVIVIGITVYCLLSKKARKLRTTCKSCANVYDYDEDVEWEIIHTGTSSNNHGEAKEKATVAFTCTCPSCGTVRKFNKTFTTAKVDSNGNYSDNNIDTLIEKFMKPCKQKK